MNELFELSCTESIKKPIAPEQPDSVLATKCSNCEATFPEPRCSMPECMCCESEDLEQMEWHDYVISLKSYTNKLYSEMDKISAYLKSEYKKTLRYIDLMKDKEGFSPIDAMISYNRGAGKIVEEFELKLWDQ